MTRYPLNYGTFEVSRTTYQQIPDPYYLSAYGYVTRPANWYPPLKSAEASAEVFRRALPLTAADLLADPAFRAAARRAAEAGKGFSAECLRWERKPVVVEAVAVVRAEVEAERAEAARVAAAARAEADAKWAREAPVRDAVTAAYEDCGYRTCRQGHSVRVEIGGHVGVSAATSAGDRYSSRCTYRKVESSHVLRVRPDYLDRLAGGDATADGCLVLDAELRGLCPETAAPVYRLTVVRQDRGTGLRTERVERTLSADGTWAPLPRRAAVVEMPAPILADYLQERGVIDEAQAVAMRTR